MLGMDPAGGVAVAQGLTVVQHTKVLDGTDATSAAVATWVRTDKDNDVVYVGVEMKEHVSPFLSHLHVRKLRCLLSAGCLGELLAATSDAGPPMRGQIDFMQPSGAIGPGPTPYDALLRVARRGRFDVVDGGGETLDCDGDGLTYSAETTGPDITELDLLEVQLEMSGSTPHTTQLIDGGDCVDRGVSFARVAQMPGQDDTMVAFTLKPPAGDRVLMSRRTGGTGPVTTVVLATAAEEDHPGMDFVAAGGTKVPIVADHKCADTDGSGTCGASEEGVQVRFPAKIGAGLPETPVGLNVNNGGDRPYVSYHAARDRLFVVYHVKGAADAPTHRVDLHWCSNASVTGCDDPSDWSAPLTVAGSDTLRHRNASIVFEGDFQAVVFEREKEAGLEFDGEVVVATRCVVGGGGAFGAPFVVKAAEEDKIQSLERGKPFAVLNPDDDLIHVVYREEEEFHRDEYEGLDNDAWWSTLQFTPCPP